MNTTTAYTANQIDPAQDLVNDLCVELQKTSALKNDLAEKQSTLLKHLEDIGDSKSQKSETKTLILGQQVEEAQAALSQQENIVRELQAQIEKVRADDTKRKREAAARAAAEAEAAAQRRITITEQIQERMPDKRAALEKAARAVNRLNDKLHDAWVSYYRLSQDLGDDYGLLRAFGAETHEGKQLHRSTNVRILPEITRPYIEKDGGIRKLARFGEEHEYVVHDWKIEERRTFPWKDSGESIPEDSVD